MTFNWKKTSIVLADIALAVYLVLAISAFNRPDVLNEACNEVKIDIKNNTVKGFLNAEDIKQQLRTAHLYPLGEAMENVNVRSIEEALLQNPLVESAECYKTQRNTVHITLTQRLPVIRVKADNGEDYYVDNQGNIMPTTRYNSDLVVVTGNVTRKYAQKVLAPIGNYILGSRLWHSQIEQLNILTDGSVEMVPRVGDHIVYLGPPVHIGQKLKRLEKFYKYGLSEAGWNKYSYISLEFDNQIICKKRRL